MVEKALFVTEAEGIGELLPSEGRLYFGHEFCHWRLAGRGQVEDLRRRAADVGLLFTLVTPLLHEEGLSPMMKLLEALSPSEGDEVVVNDVGLLERLSRESWSGAVTVGRVLTRQRRGAGWKEGSPGTGAALRYLRGSSLDSPGFVEWFRDRYGVRRFEIDNLLQGVEVGDLPGDVRLSVYYPYLFLTATSLCPWTFDGRRWRKGEGCPACRGQVLELHPEEGGRPILMGGGVQFIENDTGVIYRGPGVDRLVRQPRIPA
jgi:hypothetical protein